MLLVVAFERNRFPLFVNVFSLDTLVRYAFTELLHRRVVVLEFILLMMTRVFEFIPFEVIGATPFEENVGDIDDTDSLKLLMMTKITIREKVNILLCSMTTITVIGND